MKPRMIAIYLILCMGLLLAVCYFFPQQGIKIGSMLFRLPPIDHLMTINQNIPVPADSLTSPLDTLNNHSLTEWTDTIAVTSLADTIVPTEPKDTIPEKVKQKKPKSTKKKDSVKKSQPTQDTLPPTTRSHPSHTAGTAYEDSLRAIDTRIFLQRFYKSLLTTDTASVRVVHYGDSQIESDRMTQNLRSTLQSRYGGSGAGIVPLHQTISSQTIKQTLLLSGVKQSVQNGPKRYLAYGQKTMRRQKNVYGPMAQVAVMDNALVSGSEDVTLTLVSNKKMACRGFSLVRVLRERDSIIYLPDTVTSFTLTLHGKGDVYGVSLESRTGVIVDNIPLRGCSGTIFTGVDKRLMKHFFNTTNTRLIIMQFGGNVMPCISSKKVLKDYVERIRKQLRYMHECAPEASILFVGPSDMLTSQHGNRMSYPLLGDMDQLLRQTAIEEQCAYWSLYEAMGGSGGMRTWQDKGWAGKDGIHFTWKGANQAGNLLSQWLLEPMKKQYGN